MKEMNPNSIYATENEVLRARLKRNKELAYEIIHIVRAPGRFGDDDIRLILEKLNRIIVGD